MDTQELVNYLDELLYDSTGKHIDSLQVAILKGVLNGEKYQDIAKEYKCSASHAKDEAYKLWRSLSQTFNEDINKSNFKAVIDRIISKNNKFPVANRIPVLAIAELKAITGCAFCTMNKNKGKLEIPLIQLAKVIEPAVILELVCNALSTYTLPCKSWGLTIIKSLM
jgi:hypothetical protein